MRKILLIASAIAVTMTACNGGGGKTQDNVEQAAGDTVNRVVSDRIAYIKLDSLMQNYNMFIDLSSEFEAKAKKVEGEITSRGRSLEKAVADAQDKFEKGLVTRAEGAQLQEDLQRREQNFYQFREQKERELSEENQVMTNKIFHSVNDFVKEFNKDYTYGMIFTTSGGAPIMHADPQLDITDVVLKALNEKYAKEKGAKK